MDTMDQNANWDTNTKRVMDENVNANAGLTHHDERVKSHIIMPETIRCPEEDHYGGH